MAFTLEQTQFLNSVRQKARSDAASLDELREALRIMRQDRVAASTGSTASRTKKAAAAAPVNTDAVLDKLKALGAGLKSQQHEG